MRGIKTHWKSSAIVHLRNKLKKERNKQTTPVSMIRVLKAWLAKFGKAHSINKHSETHLSSIVIV